MSTITLDELIKQGEELIDYLGIPTALATVYRFKNQRAIDKYGEWKMVCIRFLSITFQEDRCNEDFEIAIQKFENKVSPANLTLAVSVLRGCREIPSIIVTKKKEAKKDSSVHVNVNQHQQQSQEQRLALDLFISAIDDELTGKQRKELKAYLEDTKDLPEAERKQGIVEKLTNFGKDLGLNILANIIANPTIWGGL